MQHQEQVAPVVHVELRQRHGPAGVLDGLADPVVVGIVRVVHRPGDGAAPVLECRIYFRAYLVSYAHGEDLDRFDRAFTQRQRFLDRSFLCENHILRYIRHGVLQ